MTILVTGGAGFVGRAVVRALLARGEKVRVLDVAADPPLPLGVDLRLGSVTDAVSVSQALVGVEAVIHLAALAHLWLPDPQAYQRVNVRGTEVVLSKAMNAGVPRLVHCSSYVTLIGRSTRRGTPLDPAAPGLPVEQMLGPYPLSKRQSEQVAEGYAAQGLPVSIVQPTAPLGPEDYRRTPPTQMVRDLSAGRIPAMLEGMLNLVDVRDVAQGVLAALDRGEPGRRYVLAGQDLRTADLLALVGGVSGRRMPRARVPAAVALLAARAEAQFPRRQPKAPLSGVQLAVRQGPIIAEPSREALGLPAPRSLEEAVREALR